LTFSAARSAAASMSSIVRAQSAAIAVICSPNDASSESSALRCIRSFSERSRAAPATASRSAAARAALADQTRSTSDRSRSSGVSAASFAAFCTP
jgi:hypothetical protein